MVFVCIALMGCDKMTEKNKSGTNEIQTELGDLPHLMSLPKQPVSVKWRLDEDSERGTGNLMALLKFEKSDYKYILDNSPSFENKMNAKMPIEFYDKWLPEEAKTGIQVKKYFENLYELIGIQGLEPKLFTKTPMSPYIHGDITPLRNEYVWVLLYSM